MIAPKEKSDPMQKKFDQTTFLIRGQPVWVTSYVPVFHRHIDQRKIKTLDEVCIRCRNLFFIDFSSIEL